MKAKNNTQDMNQLVAVVKKELASSETLKPLSNSFKELHLTNPDKKAIIQELATLCFLRGEEIDDYDFEIWLDYWASNGYTKVQVLEMIELGKKLPKYGTIKLAIGDLITHWEKSQEEIHNISWTAFLQCLETFLNKDKELLNRLSLELLGVEFIRNEDRNKIYNFLLWQVNQIQVEKNKVEHADLRLSREAAINVFKDIKQDDYLNNKANSYIKKEIIYWLNQVKEYFLNECTKKEPCIVEHNGVKKIAKDQNGKDIYQRKYNGEKMLVHINRQIEKFENEITEFNKKDNG